MNQKQLAAEIEKWFKTRNLSEKNFWNNNPVARIMKEKLCALGYWKNLPRGNPKKAFRLMKEKIARKNGREQNNEQ
jgi:hypothetical protein